MTDRTQMAALLRFLVKLYPNFRVEDGVLDAWMVVCGHLDYKPVFDAVHELASAPGAWAPSAGDVATKAKSYTARRPVGASDIALIGEALDEIPLDEHYRLLKEVLDPAWRKETR